MNTHPVHDEQDTEKEWDDLLEPLLDLLIERYDRSEYRDPFAIIEITGGQMYRLESPYPDSVIIELPPRLRDFPALVSTLAALLHRSGSDRGWFDDEDGESDPCRAPLRFSLVKKTIWLPDNDCFSEGVHLMVDAIKLDSKAAQKQISLLIEHLSDDANLMEVSAEDLALF